MQSAYNFDYQRRLGESIEARVDAFLEGQYDIAPASEEQQRLGIDRILRHRQNGEQHSIEIKADWTASKTGNVFVETVSVSARNIPGWAYSSQADWLVYVLPAERRLLCVTFAELREHLPAWIRKYPKRYISNAGYYTVGHLVPLREFEKVCDFEGVLP